MVKLFLLANCVKKQFVLNVDKKKEYNNQQEKKLKYAKNAKKYL